MVFLLLAGAGCSTVAPTAHQDASRELERHRSLWEEQAVDDYRYVASRGCFCPVELVAPVIVEVRDGRVTSRTYKDSGEPVAEMHAERWPPIEGVFDIVQDALDEDADSISVEYDRERGFPTSISIDYMQEAADEELTYEAGEFEPL